MSHELQSTHWNVPEDSVPWNPTYLMSRVAEYFKAHNMSFEFIGTIDAQLVGIGTHINLKRCIGYEVQLFHYDALLHSIMPVGEMVIWDGENDAEFKPLEYLNAFKVPGWLKDRDYPCKWFIAHAFEKSVYLGGQ